MSYVRAIASLCLPSASVPASLKSLADISDAPYDPHTFLYAPSRNGWLNQCLSELVQAFGPSALPCEKAPFLTFSTGSLSEPIAELRELLELVATDPLKLPAYARWQASADTLAQAALPGPQSLAAAQEDFQRVNADGEGDDLPALLAFLWCQLRLMEYARDNQLSFISSEVDA